MQQDTLRNLVIAGAVFLTIMVIVPKLLPPPPQRPDGPPATEPATEAVQPPEGTDRPGPSPQRSDQTDKPTAEETPSPDRFTVEQADTEQTVSIGSELTNGLDEEAPPSPYRMRLTLSTVGASVQRATMTDHAAKLHTDERYVLLSPVEGEDGRRYGSLSIEKVNIDNADVRLSDKRWHLGDLRSYDRDGERGERVEFWIRILEDGVPILKLTRILELPQQPRESHRHDVRSDILVENLSGESHSVVVTYHGGIGIPPGTGRLSARNLDYGIFAEGLVSGHRVRQSKVTRTPEKPVELYAAGEADQHFSWAATNNTYFTCTVAPIGHDGKGLADYIERVEAYDVDGSPATENDVTIRFVTALTEVAPGQRTSYPSELFLGQKEMNAFREIEPYRSRNYYCQISQSYGFCTFSWLVELMIWLLNGLHFVVRDYGVAIIMLVLIVRTLLHPITKKGQINMVRMQHRMQEMAPKIEEIKKKYANDKARLNQEMMKLNINPAGQLITCLPMMIQMPIWVALWLSLSNNIGMRHAPFLFTWIHDLTAQDALYTFSKPIVVPLFGWELPYLNLLPILVGVFMYTQQKLQPKPAPNPNMTDQQRQQQDMMKKMGPMMSIMMLIIFYKMPSGLNLYIMTSSLFGTIEQHWIRRHIKEQEEAGTLHKPKAATESGPFGAKKRSKPSFFARLQAMAEEAQKAQSKRPRKKGKNRR